MIIRDLELSSGVCRTTYRGRLHDVDVLVRPYLLEFFARKQRFEVHDWAASDGLVASEWAWDLFRMFPFCRFTASDLTLYLVEVRRGKREAFIFEPTVCLFSTCFHLLSFPLTEETRPSFSQIVCYVCVLSAVPNHCKGSCPNTDGLVSTIRPNIPFRQIGSEYCL